MPNPEELATITALQKRIDSLEAELKSVPRADPEEKKKLEDKIAALEAEVTALKESGKKPAGGGFGDHFLTGF